MQGPSISKDAGGHHERPWPTVLRGRGGQAPGDAGGGRLTFGGDGKASLYYGHNNQSVAFCNDD